MAERKDFIVTVLERRHVLKVRELLLKELSWWTRCSGHHRKTSKKEIKKMVNAGTGVLWKVKKEIIDKLLTATHSPAVTDLRKINAFIEVMEAVCKDCGIWDIKQNKGLLQMMQPRFQNQADLMVVNNPTDISYIEMSDEKIDRLADEHETHSVGYGAQGP